jgi:membrane protease YdiL (CAAX protease family)
MREFVTVATLTFACQECGTRVTFPGERGGHTETCPHCSSYIDVPDKSDPDLLSETQTAVQAGEPEGEKSRTSTQLWIEVFAVLCLAYLPYVTYAVIAFNGTQSSNRPFARDRFHYIVDALQISMPLLVIMALSGDPWALFGIVRPKWIIDTMLACAIWFGEYAIHLVVVRTLPVSLWAKSSVLHVAPHVGSAGVPACLLTLAACLAGGFTEELAMRGYLIPRLERLLRSTWLAVLVTCLLFGSYHLYQGAGPAIALAAGSLVHAFVFCTCRRLWPLCLAHALHNFLIYI